MVISDASLNMDFIRMLCYYLLSWWLPLTMKSYFPMPFHLNWTFIGENHVVERLICLETPLGKFQSLLLIRSFTSWQYFDSVANHPNFLQILFTFERENFKPKFACITAWRRGDVNSSLHSISTSIKLKTSINCNALLWFWWWWWEHFTVHRSGQTRQQKT